MVLRESKRIEFGCRIESYHSNKLNKLSGKLAIKPNREDNSCKALVKYNQNINTPVFIKYYFENYD